MKSSDAAVLITLAQKVIAGYELTAEPMVDPELDDEQPRTISVRLTLGDVRKARRLLGYLARVAA
jgi:hypothetical protein